MGAFRGKRREYFPSTPFFFSDFARSRIGFYFHLSYFHIFPFNLSSWLTKPEKPSLSTSCPIPSSPTSRMPLRESTKRAREKSQPRNWEPSCGCWDISKSQTSLRGALGKLTV